MHLPDLMARFRRSGLSLEQKAAVAAHHRQPGTDAPDHLVVVVMDARLDLARVAPATLAAFLAELVSPMAQKVLAVAVAAQEARARLVQLLPAGWAERELHPPFPARL